MARSRHLLTIALLAGTLAGLSLFLLQRWTVMPLIEQAETYEAQARTAAPTLPSAPIADRKNASRPNADTTGAAETGWQPAEGFERTALTALATVFTGVGFAAVLLGLISLDGRPVTPLRGAMWGVAGFACCVLAPALGMLPLPPGVEAADLHLRQLWWLGTAAATAAGLYVLLRHGRRSTAQWVVGLFLLVLPHVIGPPAAPVASAVPAALARSFAIESIATNAVFWLMLGTVVGFLGQQRARDLALSA